MINEKIIEITKNQNNTINDLLNLLFDYEEKIGELNATISRLNNQIEKLKNSLPQNTIAEKYEYFRDNVYGAANLSLNDYHSLINIYNTQGKIYAIKEFRRLTGCGLRDSKYAIDYLETYVYQKEPLIGAYCLKENDEDIPF